MRNILLAVACSTMLSGCAKLAVEALGRVVWEESGLNAWSNRQRTSQRTPASMEMVRCGGAEGNGIITLRSNCAGDYTVLP